MEARLQGSGIYPVRDAVDLAMTCMQTMMDANLALQIRMATGGEEAAVGGRGAWPRSWGELKALVLERGRGEAAAPAADGEAVPLAAAGTGEVAAPAPPPRLPSFFSLAPQIVTICGGSFSPFDFGLSQPQHTQRRPAFFFVTHSLCSAGSPSCSTGSSLSRGRSRCTSRQRSTPSGSWRGPSPRRRRAATTARS